MTPKKKKEKKGETKQFEPKEQRKNPANHLTRTPRRTYSEHEGARVAIPRDRAFMTGGVVARASVQATGS